MKETNSKRKFSLCSISVIDASETGAPTAFRIWKSGVNLTDNGETIFSPRSAELLMAEQEARGNLYSIDVDHLSLKPEAKPEQRIAAGWHRLEVRKDENGNPELWASEVEWVEEYKAAIESKPPKFRYYSPAYYLDENCEVISYTNTALTNNPATWNCNLLANKAGINKEIRSMDKEMLDKALAALMASGLSDEEKAAAAAVLKSALKPEAEAQSAVEPEKEKPVEPKADSVANKSELALAKRVAELEALMASKEVEKMVMDNMGKKIPASLKDWALKQNMDSLKIYLASAPVIGSGEVTLRQDSAISQAVRPGEADPESEKLDRLMGISKKTDKFGMDSSLNRDGRYEIQMISPSEARARKAAKK